MGRDDPAKSRYSIGEFQQACTPGYYNNEGGKLEGGGFFGEQYGGGPIEFHDIIRKWHADGR